MPEKILVIDDEAGIRNSLASYLRLEGYEVNTAENGKEALEKIRVDRYAIVLLDINMPGISGIDTLQAIKAFEFSCQVIMMTGAATIEKTMDSMEYGATDFILKPFDSLEEVLELVKISEERIKRWRKSMAKSIERTQDDGSAH